MYSNKRNEKRLNEFYSNEGNEVKLNGLDFIVHFGAHQHNFGWLGMQFSHACGRSEHGCCSTEKDHKHLNHFGEGSCALLRSK